jgi:hypothetical protein
MAVPEQEHILNCVVWVIIEKVKESRGRKI